MWWVWRLYVFFSRPSPISEQFFSKWQQEQYGDKRRTLLRCIWLVDELTHLCHGQNSDERHPLGYTQTHTQFYQMIDIQWKWAIKCGQKIEKEKFWQTFDYRSSVGLQGRSHQTQSLYFHICNDLWMFPIFFERKTKETLKIEFTKPVTGLEIE